MRLLIRALRLAGIAPIDIVQAPAFKLLCLDTTEVIDALGPGGYLVNISRGSNVDEPYLVDALVNGRLAGAGLDVFAREPHVPEALFALDNVVLQPHVGSGSQATRDALGQFVVDNLAAFFAGRPLLTPV